MVNLCNGKVTVLPALLQARSGHASVFFNKCIYVAGGQTSMKNKKQIIDSIERYENLLFLVLLPIRIIWINNFHSRYDFENNAWKQCSPMTTARSLLTMVVAHSFIYAIGGIINEGVSSCVEKYDPNSNLWVPIPSMTTPRSAAAAAVLNDRIYVLGGSTKINSNETASVERFDRTTNSWTMVYNCRENVNCKYMY